MRKIHLALGITFGLLFLLLGLTGSALVYREEIQSQTQPMLGDNYLEHRFLSLAQMQAALSEEFNQLEVRSLTVPKHPQGLYLFVIKYADSERVRFQRLWVNPINAETIAVKEPDALLRWIYQLHTGELVAAYGYQGVGIIGIGILMLLFTGLLSWWPGFAKLKRSLTIPASCTKPVLYTRIHRLSGLLLVPIYVVIVVTGVMLVFREQFISPWQSEAEVTRFSNVSQVESCISPTLDNIRHRAERLFPDAYIHFIKLPRNSKRSIEVTLQHDDEVPTSLGLTKVYLDTRCLSLVGVIDGRKLSYGEALLENILALHNGGQFGILGRITFVMFGITPLIFLITGLLTWQYRRRQQMK